MSSYNRNSWNWLRFFAIFILVLGILFRFVNIEKKIYWGDETVTSIRLAGYTYLEINRDLSEKIVSVRELKKYESLNSEKTLADTIKTLAIDEAHRPPLYYILIRIWAQLFGDSIGTIRLFSAVVSLLLFPCIYWLCWELFGSSMIGWITLAIVAISPFHVLYAQEAREYSLWTVSIVLSSAALLRAIRTDTKQNWMIYAITLGLAFYTQLLSLLVVITHGIYLIILERFRLGKKITAYFVASVGAFLAFIPWLWVMIENSSGVKSSTNWATVDTGVSSLVINWIYNVSYVFIDFFYVFTLVPDNRFDWGFGKFLIPTILVAIATAIYLLVRQTKVRIWLFILILTFIPALGVILPDLLFGGYASIMSRYFIPSYLAMELAIAYLLTKSLDRTVEKTIQISILNALAILIIGAGILSCAVSSQVETWWNKRTTSYDEINSARIINQSPKPLLISPSVPFVISHRLEDRAKIMLIDKANIPKIPKSFDKIFIIKPSENLRNELQQKQNLKIDLVYKGRKQNLYQLK